MASFLAGVMELPRNCVEESNKTGLADTATEERVGRKCAESVVADLGVSRRGSSVDEGEVVIGRQDRSVQEDEPDVYSQC